MMESRPELKIPTKLLRSKNEGRKDVVVDNLSSPTVKFNSVSVDYVAKFYEDLINLKLSPEVKLYQLTKKVEDCDVDTTGALKGWGKLEIPFRKKALKVKKKFLKEKLRNKWTTADVVNFVILPWMRKFQTCVIDQIPAESVGKPFQGAFVSQARNCVFADLVESLTSHFNTSGKGQPGFVWLDIFCANQPHLCDNAFDEKEQKEKFDLLKFGLHHAIDNFDERLIFFDDFNEPKAIERAWCIWEIYGFARQDLNFEIISTKQVQQMMKEQFLKGKMDVLEVLGLLNVQQLKCFNEDDKKMIQAAVESLPGGFSELKQTLTDKFRKWVLNFANNLRLERLTALEVLAKENHSSVSSLYEAEDGICLREIGSMLIDFGEFDLAITFEETAAEIFENLGDRHNKSRCDLHLGTCYLRKNLFIFAVKCYQKVLDFQLSAEKKDEVMIANAYNNMGIVNRNLKHYAKAQDFYDKAIQIRTKIYGKESQEVVQVLLNKQALLNVQERYKEAVELGEDVVKLSEKAFKGDHVDKARVLTSLANSYAMTGEFNKALDCQLKALKIKSEIFGPSHVEVGIDYMNLGNCYDELGDDEKTETNYMTAKKIFDEHTEILQSANVTFNLGLLFKKQDRKTEAIEMLKDAKNGYTKIYGEENELVKQAEFLLQELQN